MCDDEGASCASTPPTICVLQLQLLQEVELDGIEGQRNFELARCKPLLLEHTFGPCCMSSDYCRRVSKVTKKHQTSQQLRLAGHSAHTRMLT
jgi:hypothetical protein